MKTPQKWIVPPRPPIPAKHLPDPRKPYLKGYPVVEPEIRKWASQAGVADQAEKILAFTRDAMSAYVRDCVRDQAAAWPDAIKPMRDRLQRAADLLDLNQAESTILRATSVSPFTFERARDVLEATMVELDRLAESKGDLTVGGWPALDHARQFALAKKFWGAFLSIGLPTNTNAKSLMHRLFKMVLEAAGEERATIKRLLESAKPNT